MAFDNPTEITKNCIVCGIDTRHVILYNQIIGNVQKHTCSHCKHTSYFFKDENDNLVEIQEDGFIFLYSIPHGS